MAAAHERLAGVWLECLTWEELLDRWDRPGALFFLHPPYRGTENHYGKDLFAAGDFVRLADRLERLKGRFILTVNDHLDTQAAFGRFRLKEATVTYTTGGHDQKPGQGELIVTPG